MARDRNTFAKHQREIQKKQKKMEKMTRRQKKKERADGMVRLNSGDRPANEQ
jgi:hypothetical protein